MLENKINLPKLNLQLFADDGFFGGTPPEGGNPILSDDTPPEPSPDTETDDVEPGADEGDQDTDPIDDDPEPTPSGKAEPADPEPVDFLDIKSKIDSIFNKMEGDNKQNEPPEANDEPPAPTQEEIDKMNNDFYAEFTERPLEAIQKLIEERASAKVAPVMEYFDNVKKMEYWSNQLQAFESEHPDFSEYAQEVSKIIQSDDSIRNSKNPIELAYKLAKVDSLEAKARPIDQQLKDEGVLKELLSNPEIKNLLVQELKLTKPETPKVIGGTGQSSITVNDKPKNLRDATKAWLNS